jgi:hypothetical protein
MASIVNDLSADTGNAVVARRVGGDDGTVLAKKTKTKVSAAGFTPGMLENHKGSTVDMVRKKRTRRYGQKKPEACQIPIPDLVLHK